ncbi:MAG: enoyl-CoA hydratase, partial [Acidobacteria bacterium]
MTYQFLEITRDGPVERVALNRPDVRNAFNEGMIAEIHDWADRAARDVGLRVAILEGRGRAFSAGADLAWMERVAAYTREENLRDASALAGMFAALDRLPKPLVGRVHGAALGGGSGLVAVCDIVVAEENAFFAFTEVRLGLTPAVIAPYVIAKIGQSPARELFLRGARFGAGRARE